MKITLIAPKPRNPLVALARFRRAGSHRVGDRTQRQQGRRALQRELNWSRQSL